MMRRLWLILLLVMMMVGVLPVAAQGTLPQPLNVNENKQGVLTAEAPTATYIVNVSAAQGATLQVLALAPGMFPTINMSDPTGVTVINLPGNGTSIAQTDVSFTSIGNYTIIVTSANGILGEFVISLIGGAPLNPPQPIPLATVVEGAVDPQTPLQAFTFAASATEVLVLRLDAPPGVTTLPLITLQDGVTSETLAIASQPIAGVTYRLPAGAQTYVLYISHSGALTQEQFRVCVGTDVGATSCPASGVVAQPNVPTATPFVAAAIPPNGPCSVVSSSGAIINVRSAPSTNAAIVSRLQPTALATVLGRLPDRSWYQVNVSGVIGWISGSVITVGGLCSGVLIVTPTPGPTAIVTSLPTFTPTASATAAATITPPPAVATLNFSLPPVFGSTALTSGFVPDPFTVGITAGGPANVNYLGGGCSGFATSAPSFSVNYTAGAFPTLRFYFIGSGDTTMIINAPSASYFCVDDSFGTLNPTIDFNTPSSGRYDVWVATFAQGASVGGTLYVTENTGNRP
jgi:uncharacterized protein YraI